MMSEKLRQKWGKGESDEHTLASDWLQLGVSATTFASYKSIREVIALLEVIICVTEAAWVVIVIVNMNTRVRIECL